MHLLTIVAFAFLFWRAEDGGRWVLLPAQDRTGTLLITIGFVAIVAVGAVVAARRTAWLHRNRPEQPDAAQHFYHQTTVALRLAAGIGFGATVFLTRWPEWFDINDRYPYLQILADLVVLSPFLASMILMWTAFYPLERLMRGEGDLVLSAPAEPGTRRWSFRTYMDFHVRHYLLVVAGPMILILFTANMTRGYASTLQSWTGWAWAPDFVLGTVACVVFAIAPLLLRRIWRTVRLESGEVRQSLDTLARSAGLRFRDILKWQSDGLMINAAVMGIIAPVRYVLLSDGLLAAMSSRQIEAVFGHEIGHVRHRHIQHFLLFAYVGWLATAGTMELLARVLLARQVESQAAILAVEGIGVLVAVVVWGAGFGWLSRRFERQADLFAARCVTPPADRCVEPCGVHPGDGTSTPSGPHLCATAASVFASSLDRVAILNGIPHEERSWRHSSIGYRIRFLKSLAGDPNRLARFERVIHRAKAGLLVAAVVGTGIGIAYWLTVTEPAILQIQAALPR